MPTLRQPLDLRIPRVSSLAGNTYFNAIGLTDWDAGHWVFVKDVDGKIYGQVIIAKNLSPSPNPKIILDIGANATTGVTRLKVATKAVSEAETFNPAALTDETSQDITVPATAYFRKTVTFTITEAIAADDILVIELFHEGAHANDTLAVDTLLFGAYLQLDLTETFLSNALYYWEVVR